MPEREENIETKRGSVNVPEPMVMQRASPSSQRSSNTSNSDHSSNIMNKGPNQSSPTSPHDQGPQRRTQRQKIPRLDSNEDNGGILSNALAWVQRKRERRRVEQLQHEAEEQLRKIAEAEGLTKKGEFNPASASSGNDNGNHNAGDVAYGTQHLSKSGEGLTAELDWDLQEDELLIPKVRVHAETKMIQTCGNGDGESPQKADFKMPAYLLTPEQMHQVAIHVLPKTVAYCQWRRIYSLTRDGDSFNACLRIISEVPRSLMVVRTTKGEIFGGYADAPWRPMEMGNARFYGSAQACLFAVKEPDKPTAEVKYPKSLLKVYKWSGKNRYIQLCDRSSKMLAFGGGGNDGAFGLCVQEDFQTGSTGPCDTFDNEPLCKEGTFEIVDVEFWEFLTGIF